MRDRVARSIPALLSAALALTAINDPEPSFAGIISQDAPFGDLAALPDQNLSAPARFEKRPAPRVRCQLCVFK